MVYDAASTSTAKVESESSSVGTNGFTPYVLKNIES
jgi:hypothetical protein